jgi:queuosine precursor transporter
MNELIFALLTVVAFGAVLIGVRIGRDGLLAVAVIFTLLSNIFFMKLGLIFGTTTSFALPLYSAIFLASHLLIEHHDSKDAVISVKLGFFSLLVMLACGFFITRAVPTGELTVSDAYDTIFGFLPRLAFAAMIAYGISQTLNIFLFKFFRNMTKGKHVWLRNFFSITISQAIDTAIFVTVTFYGKMDGLFTFGLVYWILKTIVAALAVPFTYLSFKIKK